MNKIDFTRVAALREEAVENMLIADAARGSAITESERCEAGHDEAYWRGCRDTLDKVRALLR